MDNVPNNRSHDSTMTRSLRSHSILWAWRVSQYLSSVRRALAALLPRHDPARLTAPHRPLASAGERFPAAPARPPAFRWQRNTPTQGVHKRRMSAAGPPIATGHRRTPYFPVVSLDREAQRLQVRALQGPPGTLAPNCTPLRSSLISKGSRAVSSGICARVHPFI